MAYKGSFYYDEYDLDNYEDSFEYSYDENLPSLDIGEVFFNCAFTILRQISQQLLYLIAINFIYRLIRQTG